MLLEHQSTPDPWLRLRLLKYSIGSGKRDRQRHPTEKQLRPIVPLVLYQGGRVWRAAHEFAELFAEAVRDWPGVPHYAHLLIDQTQAGPDELRGQLLGRIAQLAMMAAHRASWPVLQRLVPLLTELAHMGGSESSEDLKRIVVYIAITTREPERWHRFAEAVLVFLSALRASLTKRGSVSDLGQRHAAGCAAARARSAALVPHTGADGHRSLGEVSEAATGIDDAAFDRLKHQLDAADERRPSRTRNGAHAAPVVAAEAPSLKVVAASSLVVLSCARSQPDRARKRIRPGTAACSGLCGCAGEVSRLGPAYRRRWASITQRGVRRAGRMPLCRHRRAPRARHPVALGAHARRVAADRQEGGRLLLGGARASGDEVKQSALTGGTRCGCSCVVKAIAPLMSSGGLLGHLLPIEHVEPLERSREAHAVTWLSFTKRCGSRAKNRTPPCRSEMPSAASTAASRLASRSSGRAFPFRRNVDYTM